MLTYKSPLGPPLVEASPIPAIFNFCPSSIPAGILTVLTTVSFSVPKPWHLEHFFSGIFPLPWQSGQIVWVCTVPKKVLCCVVTWPLPLQVEQVFSLWPGSAPSPLQCLQEPVLLYLISFSTPSAASSRLNSTVYLRSAPGST